MFTKDDVKQIEQRGVSVEDVKKQMEYLKKGFPYASITAPATLNSGIKKFSETEITSKISKFNNISKEKKIVKFVPASGAASRMFKAYFSFIQKQEKIEDNAQVKEFFENIDYFAFYDELKSLLDKENITVDEENIYQIVDLLINKQGLNYGHLPKALILFHKYKDRKLTPIDEHLYEAEKYSKDKNNTSSIVFTVSPEHKKEFINKLEKSIAEFEKIYKTSYSIKLTEQKPSTDTIAVDENNNLFRNSDGTLLFRPGGHGALIENLNEIDADVVFIKNIDNVVHQQFAEETIRYKKLLAVELNEIQEQIFKYLHQIDNKNFLLKEIEDFAKTKLNIKFSDEYKNFDDKNKAEYLHKKLNRPVRICGMVKNEGEPGGGPFWVKHTDGSEQLQIVESAEIDMQDATSKQIVNKATHFNPVDLVCGLKNYKSEKFDLKKYVNPDTGFISSKSKDGKALKALELPGLWNGAMYDWNTIFVEVPLITFNPVKILNDLLRKTHCHKKIKEEL